MLLLRIALALAATWTLEAQELQIEWSKADTAREVAFLSLLAVDYLQTRDLIRNPRHKEPGKELYEQNLLLGPRPTMGELNTYMAISAFGHVIVSMMIPAGKWRTTWQGFGIAVEGAVVANNARIGLRVKW